MKMRLSMLLGLLALAGCVSSSSAPPQGERLTVGTVQREIRIGMTGSQVAEVLGSLRQALDRSVIFV
jgi:outer membrane protein assembly factor BamE (lipoprotein component of BamABCDE complex)